MGAGSAKKPVEKQPLFLKAPPTLLTALALVGPGVVWAAEAIGSGELILSTRLGAAFGLALIWVPAWAVLLKNLGPGYLHGRWAAVFGEGAIDMYARIPPRRFWSVLFGILHIVAGAMSIGALAASVGAVTWYLFGTAGPVQVYTVIMYLITLTIAMLGVYSLLEIIFMGMMASMVVSTLAVAIASRPPAEEVVRGLFSFTIPPPAEWAVRAAPGVEPVAAAAIVSILPVLAWAAGGSASHVWYSYWVVGSKTFGMARYGEWGRPGDVSRYKEASKEDIEELRRWIRTQFLDAFTAGILTVLVIIGFFVAGAMVLAPKHLLPGGVRLAETLATMYTEVLGSRAYYFVLIGALFILWSTNISQTVGWPILIMDGLRYIWPGITQKISTQTLRRIITVLLGIWAIAWALGYATAPVTLISAAAVLDGAVLVALQGILILTAWLYVAPKELGKVLPKEEVRKIMPNIGIIIWTAICTAVYIGFSVWYITVTRWW